MYVYLCTRTYICTCIHRQAHRHTHMCTLSKQSLNLHPEVSAPESRLGGEGVLLSRASFSSMPSKTGENQCAESLGEGD